jgi:exopolyphosphatase/pppGpp-phosphohydrolase
MSWLQSAIADGVFRVAIPSLFLIASIAAATMAQAPGQICAIDMGSNTFRRIVGSFESGRYDQTSIERKSLGVGDDVGRHGRISDAKLAEIEQTLIAFARSCQNEGVTRVVAIGTAAFRDAPNGATVIALAARHRISMEIASERRESELAYLVGSLGREGYAVIDNGSRSIELVSSEGRSRRHVVFDLGYRIAYETFFAAAENPDAAVQAFRNRLKQEAAKATFMHGKKVLIGVEFAEMADVLFDPGDVDGRVFTLQQLKQRLDQITTATPGDFDALKKRRDIDRALPRLVVAAFLTELFGYDRLELTARELGTGLIIEAGMKP